jgi:hypothetical protein
MATLISFKIDESILDSENDALLVPSNCKGTMGDGLLELVRKKYPSCSTEFKFFARDGALDLGSCSASYLPEKTIIWFPVHLKHSEEIEISFIEKSMRFLVKNYGSYNIKSISIPNLNSNGSKLTFKEIYLMMEKYFNKMPNLEKIDIYCTKEEFLSLNSSNQTT